MIRESELQKRNDIDGVNYVVAEAIDLLRGHLSADNLYVILHLITLLSENISPEIHTDENDNILEITLPYLDFTTLKDEKKKERIETLYSVHDAFRDDLRIIPNNTWSSLNFIFQKLDSAFVEKNLAEIFEYNLYRLAAMQGRVGGSHLLPVGLSRFLCSLVPLQPISTIYNPFAGFASFKIFLPENNLYLGQEINRKVWAVGTLRLIAHKKQDLSLFFDADSVEDWGFKKSFEALENKKAFESFDLIIANPPYGARLPFEAIGRFGVIRSFEHFLIEKGIDDLKHDGQLVALVSHGFLFRGGNEQNLRRFLIEADLLDKVILFPSGLLTNTGIQVAALVINKNKIEKGVVRFIDARSFVHTMSSREKILDDVLLQSSIGNNNEANFLKVVPNKEIEDFDFNFNVARYFQKNYDGRELRELGSFVKPSRIIEGVTGNFVRIRDLKDDVLEYQLSINGITETDIPKQALKIEESCLLIAGRWKTIKPTYFQYQGIPIYITPDIHAFHIDESECDITYLINELHTKYVTEQLDSLRIGESIPRLRKEDLLSIKINIPTLDEQRIKAKKALSELAQERKQELLNKIKGLEGEIFEQNTYLRHTLAGPSSNLKDAIVNIKNIIVEKIVPQNPDVLNHKLSDKHIVTLGEYLDIVERDATKIVSAVSSQLKVDTRIESKKLTEIDIIGFLEKYAIENNERPNLNYQIQFDFDEDAFLDEQGKRIETFILGNEDLLRDLFDNLIDNANKHAFTLGGQNRIEIYLMKNTEKEKDEVQILFSNTGIPFPEDFNFNDFIRKGSKSGINAGEGFGGWYINEIIKKLKGEFDIIDETGAEGLPETDLATSFEINLPIIETDENGSL